MPLFWTLVVIIVTHVVIINGVRGGIEKISKMLMPTLFILLVMMVVAACLASECVKGYSFSSFVPDWGKVTSDVFLGALGQSFYSLSIAMGCICTFASYFSRQTNLIKSAQISALDSLVAILAGLAIFPAAFSVGVQPNSGASLVFITLS